jgi:hypothetical protein
MPTPFRPENQTVVAVATSGAIGIRRTNVIPATFLAPHAQSKRSVQKFACTVIARKLGTCWPRRPDAFPDLSAEQRHVGSSGK